jgi:multidrug transporter EmrE-like cation transporter
MAMLEALPLLRLPTTWPLPVVATLCMAALAGLDLVGAFAAKEWAENKSAVALGLGVLSFLVLFWVYASSLQYAELAVVTMGWIVLLQVGILVVDRVRFDSDLPAGKLAAVVVILAAQGYLVLAPSSPAA